MDRRIFRILAWASIVAIFVVTDGPAALRPSLGFGANADRLLAFTAVGVLFALGYPRRWPTVLILLVGAAAAFEMLQLHAFGRHAHLKDFAVKTTGAVLGTLGGVAFNRTRLPHDQS